MSTTNAKRLHKQSLAPVSNWKTVPPPRDRSASAQTWRQLAMVHGVGKVRGGVVDEDALFDAAKNNLIGGTALDVFKNELYIPQMKDLRTLENVIMTPHIGSSTLEACERMALSSLQNIGSADAGNITEMNMILPLHQN